MPIHTQFKVAFAMTCLLASCSSDSPVDEVAAQDAAPEVQYPVGFNPPPPPANGVQILGKPFTVQPGEDVFMCVYLSEELSADINMSSMQAYQMSGGHHIILSSVTDNYQPETDVHICDDSEMTNHRPIGVGGANASVDAPSGVAFLAPGGKRLVIQSHYINATDEPIEVMDAVNLIAIDGTPDALAAMMVLNDLTLELPPGVTTTREMECTVSETSKVFMLTGHTHEWGRNFALSLTRAGTTDKELLYAAEAGPGFRDEPPMKTYPEDNVLQLEPGDKLSMKCEWFNDENAAIYFPKEMCSAPLFYYPSRGFEVCGQDGGGFSQL